jgi:hypothetical protein
MNIQALHYRPVFRMNADQNLLLISQKNSKDLSEKLETTAIDQELAYETSTPDDLPF